MGVPPMGCGSVVRRSPTCGLPGGTPGHPRSPLPSPPSPRQLQPRFALPRIVEASGPGRRSGFDRPREAVEAEDPVSGPLWTRTKVGG
jgi:hypothetical protein